MPPPPVPKCPGSTSYPSKPKRPPLPLRQPPPRPDRHTDRVAWNEWFETELALRYEGYAYDSIAFEYCPDALPWECHTMTWRNLTIAQHKKELMSTEGVLIAMALENITYGTFEAEWKALSMEKKRELALEGLYRGSCNCPGDNLRHACPELRIEVLIGDGEYNVINLLKCIMAHDPTGNRRVKELFLFEHPYITHEFRHTPAAPDGLKAWIYSRMLLRNYCIVDTLLGILEASTGHPGSPTYAIRYHATQPHDEEREDRVAKNREWNKKHPIDKSTHGTHCQEKKATAGYGCIKCYKIMDRNKLKLCARCQLAFYCGSECQKKDWAEHKKVCGKQDFDVGRTEPLPEAPSEFIGCPPVVNGYIRTPALWRQIWYLSNSDSQYRVYHFDTGPALSHSITIPHPPGAQNVFLVARRRAMASGSIPAIHMMFKIATHDADPSTGMTWAGLSVEQMRKQFEREYQIEITEETMRAVEPFASPTKRELREEKEFYRKRLESVG
ncbi:hypothetical protein FB45DRAFT_901686 [Roridomyces roridus]|uniref:MYND-type domain-containing protein n=1 Tax=Roridomyces roridus TaxID=1738132 RepID=A0AAD7C978_9AGAR|nr:hypothetical protein FB45DRAFT_901686 [Roridomyces roridus]